MAICLLIFCPSVCLSVCLSISLSVCLSISVCLSGCLAVCLSVCLSAWISACQSVCLVISPLKKFKAYICIQSRIVWETWRHSVDISTEWLTGLHTAVLTYCNVSSMAFIRQYREVQGDNIHLTRNKKSKMDKRVDCVKKHEMARDCWWGCTDIKIQILVEISWCAMLLLVFVCKSSFPVQSPHVFFPTNLVVIFQGVLFNTWPPHFTITTISTIRPLSSLMHCVCDTHNWLLSHAHTQNRIILTHFCPCPGFFF